jgi:hypothetical protein
VTEYGWLEVSRLRLSGIMLGHLASSESKGERKSVTVRAETWLGEDLQQSAEKGIKAQETISGLSGRLPPFHTGPGKSSSANEARESLNDHPRCGVDLQSQGVMNPGAVKIDRPKQLEIGRIRRIY